MKQTILIFIFLNLTSAQSCLYANDCQTGCCINYYCELVSVCYSEEFLFLWIAIGIDIFAWFVYLCLYFSKRKSTMLRIQEINEKARIAFQRTQEISQQVFQNVDVYRTQDTEEIIYK